MDTVKKRTARRLALMRYDRWLGHNHPGTLVPRCLLREYNRRVNRHNTKLNRRATREPQ